MNLRKTCPDIPDDWKGSMSDVCRILGDGDGSISDKTIRKRLGEFDIKRGANKRLQFTGADVKRLWQLI